MYVHIEREKEREREPRCECEPHYDKHDHASERTDSDYREVGSGPG